MATINYDIELKRAGAMATHGWRKLLFFAQRYILGTIGLVIMITFVLTALFADLICRYDPRPWISAHSLLHPDARHWMVRILRPRRLGPKFHGARISLAVGIGSTALGASIGVIIGLTSGYLSGWVDLCSSV